MKSPFDLPSEAVDFLRARRALKYDASAAEAGQVSLHPLEALTLGEVWVAPEEDDDPHRRDEGYYAIPAVSLTAACDGYDPDFILLWLPEEKKFGTWDSDHWVLQVFDGATWPDIEKSPLAYVDAQWRANSTVATRAKPWRLYPFKLGRPF
jgi:hypothetical protein